MNMKQNEHEDIDRIIDAFDMEKKTGRSRDELHALVRKGMTCLNLSYCLTDVIDWLLFDADATLSPFGAALERKDKQMFGRLKKQLANTRQQAHDITRGIYGHEDGEKFQGESDWWYNIIRLIEDRTGTNVLKTKTILQWLTTMPSELNMFNVRMKDFKRLTDHDHG